MNKSKMEESWLHPVLQKGLARVSAPRGLREQIAGGRRAHHSPEPAHRMLWMFAGVSALTASVLAVAWGYHPLQRTEIRSERAGEVRMWIHDRTGIDIPFASSPQVQVVGASLVAGKQVEVRCHVNDRGASLLVSRAESSTGDHRHPQLALVSGATKVAWRSGQYDYTLAVARPEDMRVACLMCHVESAI